MTLHHQRWPFRKAIGSLRLGKASKITKFNPNPSPAHLSATSTRFLKTSSDSESTTSISRGLPHTTPHTGHQTRDPTAKCLGGSHQPSPLADGAVGWFSQAFILHGGPGCAFSCLPQQEPALCACSPRKTFLSNRAEFCEGIQSSLDANSQACLPATSRVPFLAGVKVSYT